MGGLGEEVGQISNQTQEEVLPEDLAIVGQRWRMRHPPSALFLLRGTNQISHRAERPYPVRHWRSRSRSLCWLHLANIFTSPLNGV
jgi:hypothetical protein